MDLDMTYRLLVASLQAGPRLHDAHHAAFAYRKELKLPLIRCPVLVMAGSEDMFFSKVDSVSRLIPGSVTRIIEGAGNEPALEKPTEFAQAILDFFQSAPV
jgi:pimeloyl-ACP methyl ester carboxylesterase